jgi:hypothetical protein
MIQAGSSFLYDLASHTYGFYKQLARQRVGLVMPCAVWG